MSTIQRAADAMRAAKQIVFFTGAGISAESGIPTFRDKLTGLWAKHDPERLETAHAFRENPALVWSWYLWRRNQVSQAKPNAAHLAIPLLATAGRSVAVVTQNIDDLHERAGSSAVVHLHGSLMNVKCFACHRPGKLSPAQLEVPEEGQLIEPPRCARCNGKLRPGVVWFGENLPEDAWRSAMRLVKSCDLLISVGTSGVVMPAAGIPRFALAAKATVIHVNLENVRLGGSDEIMLKGAAGGVLSALVEAAGFGDLMQPRDST
ncbi:SIR2 family NAD-dependent protein deacylase [Pseudomonas asiatica]|uniref:SIR2 family NAD-dependent protein deacylase n=1 Tax=Pseudomonas asiatica TaxID=2219225 RepID=UPI003BA2F6C8|nr:NAD-dependent deacylase [Pseudomonas shirazica]